MILAVFFFLLSKLYVFFEDEYHSILTLCRFDSCISGGLIEVIEANET